MTHKLEEHITRIHSDVSEAMQYYALAKEFSWYEYEKQIPKQAIIFSYIVFAFRNLYEISMARLFDKSSSAISLYSTFKLFRKERFNISLLHKEQFGNTLAEKRFILPEEVSSYNLPDVLTRVIRHYEGKWEESKIKGVSVHKYIKYRRNHVHSHSSQFLRENYTTTTYGEIENLLFELRDFALILQSLLRSLGRPVSIFVAPAFNVQKLYDEKTKLVEELMKHIGFDRILSNEEE